MYLLLYIMEYFGSWWWETSRKTIQDRVIERLDALDL